MDSPLTPDDSIQEKNEKRYSQHVQGSVFRKVESRGSIQEKKTRIQEILLMMERSEKIRNIQKIVRIQV